MMERLEKRKEMAQDFLRFEDPKEEPEQVLIDDPSIRHTRKQAFQRIEMSRLGHSQMGEHFIKELKRLQKVKQSGGQESRHTNRTPLARSYFGTRASMDNRSENSG